MYITYLITYVNILVIREMLLVRFTVLCLLTNAYCGYGCAMGIIPYITLPVQAKCDPILIFSFNKLGNEAKITK